MIQHMLCVHYGVYQRKVLKISRKRRKKSNQGSSWHDAKFRHSLLLILHTKWFNKQLFPQGIFKFCGWSSPGWVVRNLKGSRLPGACFWTTLTSVSNPGVFSQLEPKGAKAALHCLKWGCKTLWPTKKVCRKGYWNMGVSSRGQCPKPISIPCTFSWWRELTKGWNWGTGVSCCRLRWQKNPSLPSPPTWAPTLRWCLSQPCVWSPCKWKMNKWRNALSSYLPLRLHLLSPGDGCPPLRTSSDRFAKRFKNHWNVQILCSQFAINLLIKQRIQAVDGNTQKLFSIIILFLF